MENNGATNTDFFFQFEFSKNNVCNLIDIHVYEWYKFTIQSPAGTNGGKKNYIDHEQNHIRNIELTFKQMCASTIWHKFGNMGVVSRKSI